MIHQPVQSSGHGNRNWWGIYQ